MSRPAALFTSARHGSSSDPLRALLFLLSSGRRLLLPLQEITAVSLLPLPAGGCVEIHTRRQVIRLGMNDLETCGKLVDLIHSGEINQIHEGTAAAVKDTSYHSSGAEKPPPRLVTLVIEILESGADTASPSPALSVTPAAAVRRPGLGFPSL